ncbi:MAG: hypothetical protein LUF87_08305 [Alistipes sp.]|nr:hypothetical protein [Alistipes sp.]
MTPRIRSILITAGILLAIVPASGIPPDRDYILEWMEAVYPAIPVDSNSWYIIDGQGYEARQADGILARRRAEGAHIAYLSGQSAEEFYRGKYVNKGHKTSVIWVVTKPMRRKWIRQKRTAFLADHSEYDAVMIDGKTMDAGSGKQALEGLRKKDICGLHYIMVDERYAPEGGPHGKILVVWTR